MARITFGELVMCTRCKGSGDAPTEDGQEKYKAMRMRSVRSRDGTPVQRMRSVTLRRCAPCHGEGYVKP
jgi:DnaJ-class molecular chaperone